MHHALSVILYLLHAPSVILTNIYIKAVVMQHVHLQHGPEMPPGHVSIVTVDVLSVRLLLLTVVVVHFQVIIRPICWEMTVRRSVGSDTFSITIRLWGQICVRTAI
jgi:hypothetical protein